MAFAHYLLITTAIIASQLVLIDSLRPLIVGLNKYSHDASCCILDSSSGKILFSQAKERISRLKHDGGAIGELLQYGLESIDATVDDVATVVSNNHHHRVLPYERRLSFYNALKYAPEDYSDVRNLLPNAQHLELSHHLAHAWSVVGTSPFQEGLIVVMDGMGETYKAMVEDIAGVEEHSGDYMHDLKLLRAKGGEQFVGQPASLSPGSTYREAESAYIFTGTTLSPIFKRWSREVSPPELYNHGFENMESMGAVYSRISSQVLGDWNACGKIMGLAPWANKTKKEMKSWYFPSKNDPLNTGGKVGLGDNFYHAHSFMKGNPFDGSFKVNWDVIESLESPNTFSNEKDFGKNANIAKSVQDDLETCAMSLVSSLKDFSGQKNVALVGGVALNSVLNGRISRELGFENTFVPPGPGDEGVAVGCALYGLQRLRERERFERKTAATVSKADAAAAAKATENVAEVWKMMTLEEPVAVAEDESFAQVEFSEYQGREFSSEDIEDILMDWAPFVTVIEHENEEVMVQAAAAKLEKGEVLAWFQGKSEFGQRALGSRSIIADPRKNNLRRLINEKIKEREWYRPLAPSVLNEHASEWFDNIPENSNISPYMSMTTTIRADKCDLIPAVCHIDNTARLQTVNKDSNALYHKLISTFHKLTKVPMILNTSFNMKNSPIVETPEDALKSFIAAKGLLSSLFMGNFEIALRPFPFSNLEKVGEKEMKHSSNSDNDEEIFDERELSIIVKAKKIYMCEMVSSIGAVGGDNAPLRIRIQGGDEGLGSDPWTVLPSQLHLEILQLLQDSGDGEDADDGSYSDGSEGVGVSDLYDALYDINGEDEEGKGLSWESVRSALDWLYGKGLVYFDSNDTYEDEGEEEEVDFEKAFSGVDIVDLRN